MTDFVTLAGWRRAIADLYAAIRAARDPAAAHALWRETRKTLFVSHDQSPLERDARRKFSGPHVYAYDPALRLSVPLRPQVGAAIEADTGADGLLRLLPFARTAGLDDVFGGELTLYWINTYGGGVFLPFRDATGGGETYGGGRYLLDGAKGADLGCAADGRCILDFNFAYFPSCAYSDRYVCPLAPAENRLPGAVRGGERHSSV